MNRKLLGMVVTIIAVAMLASPVMARGPEKAADVSNNPHLSFTISGTGVVFMTGASGNTFIWSNNPELENYGLFYHDCDTTNGGGRINNAVVVDWAMFLDMDVHPETYYNVWLYFSTDPVQALGGKSVLWALGQFAMGGAGDMIVASHPDGIFAMWHYVK